MGTYRDQVVDLRLKRSEAERFGFALTQRIIHVWNKLKALRKQQGFATVPLSLVMYKKDTDMEVEEMYRARDVQDEVEERRERHEVL